MCVQYGSAVHCMVGRMAAGSVTMRYSSYPLTIHLGVSEADHTCSTMSSLRSWARVPAILRGHGPSLTLPDRDRCPLLLPRLASPTSDHRREARSRCRRREDSSPRKSPPPPVGWRHESGTRRCQRLASHLSRGLSAVGSTPRLPRPRAISRTRSRLSRQLRQRLLLRSLPLFRRDHRQRHSEQRRLPGRLRRRRPSLSTTTFLRRL